MDEKKFMELVEELRERGFSQQEAIEEARRILGEQDMAKGGRIGYANGTQMPNFQIGGLPGFLTGFGLNLLSTPPRGNIFQTAGMAAREPFNQLQISQARSRELESERDFLRGETDRKISAADTRLDKELASRERIAGMKDGDENVMAFAEVYKDASGAPNMIKGANAAKFPENIKN